MSILNNGNVGIGTTSPTQLLEVAGTLKTTSTITNDGGIYYGGGSNLDINQYNNGYMRFLTNNNEKMRITSTGCVGIGTTSVRSNSLLDVYGAGVFGTSGYGFYVGTDATGTFLDAGTQLIRMFAGQQERIRIQSDGNVGIGLTSPSYNLSISGSVGLQGNEEYLYFHSNYSVGNNARGKIRVVGAGGGSGYGGDLRFSTRKPTNVWNEDALTIDSSGNVGIGTTSPVTQLHVSGSLQIGNGTNYGNKFTLYDDFSSGKLAYVMRDLNSDDIFGLYCNSTTGEVRFLADDDDANTAFMTFQTNASERMRITNGGNVLIGTSTSTTNGGLLQIAQVPNNTASSIGFNNEDNAVISAKYNLVFQIDNTNSVSGREYQWKKGGKGYSDGTSLMILNASGSVGIGTSSPVGKLDIRGIQNLNTSGSTGAATSGSLMVIGQNTVGGSSYHDFLYTRNTLSTATNPQKTFRLNNSGSIEIVNNAYTSVIFSLTDAGVLSTTGGGTSDIRTKQNIEYIYEDVSTTINKLKPAKFEFKNNPNVARHGFIAQDVLPIKPELVLGDGDKEAGTYGLDYDGILALTVKALQEANIKTKQLENKIETLEARLSVLENK
jgi:hypothetical protein